MTTTSKLKIIGAGEFKAKCLALLDDVACSGGVLVITKRGVPVARLVPFDEPEEETLLGSVLREEDLLLPVVEDWEKPS